jgi:hypothetical protein
MMIRLMADTWREAILRPLAMAAPNSWVYTEIVAPDFRFILALTLAVVAVLAVVMKKTTAVRRQPVFVLLGLILLSFVPWMATSGNGRYFMSYLLLVGPLCLGLIGILACSRSMKATVALLVLAVQSHALYLNNPWKPADSWALIPWPETQSFSIELDHTTIGPATTYISVTSPAFTLVAPQFPAESRWINLSVFDGSDVSKASILYDPVRKILQTSKSLKLFQRSVPRSMIHGTTQPNQAVVSIINAYLQPHQMAMKEPTDCTLSTSKGLVFTTLLARDESAEETARINANTGFWICSLQYPISAHTVTPELTAVQIEAKKVFERMETLCPRFFAPGKELISPHASGYSRSYSSSDSTLIVTRDGDLYLDYARAFNPQRISSIKEVFQPEYSNSCTNFKGRAGLPWEREI